MRALLETLAALRGTIVVALRRSRRRTVVLGSVGVAIAVAGLVVILGGSGGGGSDDLADGGGSSRSGAVTDEVQPDAADSETDTADGRPLIDGVATRSTGDADPGADADGSTAESAGAGSTDGGVVRDDDPTVGGSTVSTGAPDPSAPTGSTSTSSTTAIPGSGSSTTTEGSTTSTTPPESTDGLLSGVLDLLGLG